MCLRSCQRIRPPARSHATVISVDCSFKETKSSDFLAAQVWSRVGPDYFLLDQVHARMGFSDTLNAIRSLWAKWPEALAVLVEDKANGSAVVDVLKREISGVIAMKPEGGKESRVRAIEPLFAAGNVHFPDPFAAPWVVETVDEIVGFPNAPHDDRTDAMSYALPYLQRSAKGYWSGLEDVSLGARRDAIGNRSVGWDRPDLSEDRYPGSRRW